MLRIFAELEGFLRVTFSRLSRRDDGAGIVEYILLVVFIAVAMVLALVFFSGQLSAAFSQAGNSVPS